MRYARLQCNDCTRAPCCRPANLEFGGKGSWQVHTETGECGSLLEWVVRVYAQTGSFPKLEIYGLTSQMRRSAVSVPSNIAEGKGRSTDRDRAVFFCHARASLLELETQISIAQQLEYLVPSVPEKLLVKSAQRGRMLNALIQSLKNPENSGKPTA
jgi:four helix bundle protein